MIIRNFEHAKRRILQMLNEPHSLPAGSLSHVAERILAKRRDILHTASQHSTPFYLFDREGFVSALSNFRSCFDQHLPNHSAYYAVKSNHHPLVVRAAVKHGFGLDVSSGREFEQAIECGASQIVFSGPAKSDADLQRAIAHADRTIVNIDSFRELERLGAASQCAGKPIRAGVRITTDHHGAWSKFGIPLHDLARFWNHAQQFQFVKLQGIQFHLSWNRNASPYQNILRDLADYLRNEFNPMQRKEISFIDVGGGYRPHQLEGSFPHQHPIGALISTADEYFGEHSEFLQPYSLKESIPVEDYAAAIGETIGRQLAPLVSCAYFTEPGRIASTSALHIVLTVVDRKSDDLVIVDGGFNMVGWEKYLHVYCPIVNLTRPALQEIPMRICGSLCDCEDVWGHRCFAERIEVGDLLVVPFQGAYTWCVAQQFIRDIPPVHSLISADSFPEVQRLRPDSMPVFPSVS